MPRTGASARAAASDPVLRETLGNAARQRLQARSWSVLGPIWDRVLNAP